MFHIVFTLKSLEAALRCSTDTTWLNPTQPGPELSWGIIRVERKNVLHFVHRDDTSSDSRIVLIGMGSGQSLDKLPPDAWRIALQRVHRATLSTKTLPFRLPLGWSEYHFGNLVAFFACGRRTLGSFRWVAQISPDSSSDICFWRITDDKELLLLQNFHPSDHIYFTAVDGWADSLAIAKAKLAEAPVPSKYVPLGGVIDLKAATSGAVTGHLTYSSWIQRLTPEQLRFFDHPTAQPVKLRGPAGSGKTLTLELKALREVYEARESAQQLRVLFVTHSWTMAEQVDDALRALDETGSTNEITVFPLVEIAKGFLPPERFARGFTLLGEDSLSGKRRQLERISNVLWRLRQGDWLVYQAGASPSFRERVNSERGSPTWNSLVWDLMHEFSSVLSAANILPGITAEKRYLALRRTNWMMPLQTDAEKKFVLRVYSEHINALKAEGVLSVDQLVNDFLNYLVTFAWDYRRSLDGYDLIFVDELHLFSEQERHALNFMSRDASQFPRMFMALDPRQSPSEIYADFPMADVASASSGEAESSLGNVDAVDLTTVHRFSPEILEFVKFIQNSYPALNLGADWVVDTSALTSSAAQGDPPKLFRHIDSATEVQNVVDRASKRSDDAAGSRRVAVVLIEPSRIPEFSSSFERRGNSLVVIKSRDDVDTIRYAKRSIVLSASEYLAGLQFDDVIVAGFPTDLDTSHLSAHQSRRLLSLIYLAVSRASKQVEIHLHTSTGDLATLLQQAASAGVLETD